MINRILLDLDGVLVDFIGGACKFYNKIYDGHPHDPENQTEQKSWNIEQVFQMSASALWEPLGYEFWLNLEPLPWCHEVVELLTSRFGEENICLLTSPIRTNGCIEGKMDWIRNNLPQFRRRFLVGPSKDSCASPTSALIDDYGGNTDRFTAAGGHSFLFPAVHNVRFKECPVQALRKWICLLDTH